MGLLETNNTIPERLSFLRAGLACADIVTTLGTKAEKSLSLSPQSDLADFLEQRPHSVVSMGNGFHSGNSQELLAQKFVDLYRDLVKNG